MDNTYIYLIALSGCYFLGCLSTGYYFVLLFASKDIRDIGSKSTGATNVGRVLGRKAFIITIVIDSAKGLVIAFFCNNIKYSHFQSLLCVAALVCGHIWPVQLRFRGGKGITVLLGFLCVWSLNMVIIFAIIAILLFVIFKEFTISGLLGLLVFPILCSINHFDIKITSAMCLLIAVIYFAHKKNIDKWLNLKNINNE